MCRRSVPITAAFVVTGTLVLLRRSGTPLARAFFVAALLYSLHWTFFFGGPAMKEFSLPILIGIIVGTYSSIYIASPIVLWYAKKTGQSLRRQVLDSAAASEAAKKIERVGA